MHSLSKSGERYQRPSARRVRGIPPLFVVADGAPGSVSIVRTSILEDVLSTVLLLHAGIADSRMWHPQQASLGAAGLDVLAPDLRGFGRRPMGTEPFAHARDVEALLDGPVAVIGCSLGGRVALELAVLRPDLVERLVLIAPGLPGWAWSDETRAGWAAEEAAFESGDFDAAAEASLRQWIDGPRRSAEEVDPGLRKSVRGMILRSYELQSAEERRRSPSSIRPSTRGSATCAAPRS